MDGRGVRGIQPDSGESSAGANGEDRECPSSPSASTQPEVRADRACGTRLRGSSNCVKSSALPELQQRIEDLAATPAGSSLATDARRVVEGLLEALEQGIARAAERNSSTGEWSAVAWVKRGILLGFRVGAMVDMSAEADGARFH